MDNDQNQYNQNRSGQGAAGGQYQNHTKGEGAPGGQSTGNFDSNQFGTGFNQGSGLGDSIRNLVQSTLDSIDYGGIGAGINQAVNVGMEKAKVQMERAKEQSRRQREQAENTKGTWTGYGNYQDLYQKKPGKAVVPGKNSYKQIYPATVVSHSPKGSVAGVLLQVFGGIGAGATGICSIVFAAIFLSGVWSGSLIGLEITVPLLIASTVMIKSGNYLRKRVKQFREYVNILGGKRYGEIKELAIRTDKSQKAVVKDLRKMMKLGMFPQAHIDEEEKTLMLDYEVYEQYLEMKEYKETQEAVESAPSKVTSAMSQEEKLINEGKLYMEQIKSANDAIPGEEISQKLERLEIVTGKIFQYVAKHPEKTDEIRKFMDYYMPTTLKLVFAYKEFDAQPIQGENILNAKAEIEHSLDMVNKAFENLFDGLFQDEAMDISSDISVLQTMLKQEGLTGSDFTK